MSFSARIKTAVDAIHRLAGLNEFWNLIGSFYITADDRFNVELIRGQWTSNNASLDKSIWLEFNLSTNLLSPDLLGSITDADLTLVLVKEFYNYIDKHVRGSVATSDLAESRAALLLETFPIERIMALPESDSAEAISTETAKPADLHQSLSQAITPEISLNTLENQAPLGLAHDHDHEHEHDDFCAEGQTPSDTLSSNPPTYTGEASLARFAELSQQSSRFIPASVAGSLVGQPGLEAQLPLVQGIAVVGAVRNGALQISNSATVAIQATLGRALAVGESLRYSLNAGASWIDVPATAISDGTSVLISALVLPVGSSSLQMASFVAGGQGQISRQEIIVDTATPTAAVSRVWFNEINSELILNGTQFNSLLSNQGSSQISLLNQLDWSKLNWQTSPSGGASIGFTINDIETVKLISDQNLLIRFSQAKRSSLLAAGGYGSANTLIIGSGFLRDEVGNSTTQNGLTATPITLMKAAGGSVSTIDSRDSIDLLFASPVTRGVGEIRLHGADGTVIERFDAATSTALRLDGNRLRLDPAWALVGSQNYSITFDSGSLLDSDAAAVPGVSDVGLLQFTAAAEIGKVNGAASMRDQWPGSANSESIGNHKMLYMPITFLDVDRDPNSERDMHLSDVVDAATFFRENSQGVMPLNADYTPTITLPFTYTWYRQFETKYNGLSVTMNGGRAQALALGFDASQYNVSLIRADLNLSGGYAWGGGDNVWLPWGGNRSSAMKRPMPSGLVIPLQSM